MGNYNTQGTILHKRNTPESKKKQYADTCQTECDTESKIFLEVDTTAQKTKKSPSDNITKNVEPH